MPHSPQDIKDASNKLEYHVKGYVQTFQWLLHWRTKGLPSTLESNAVLDSHLIHARLLIFFLMKKKQETDVNASDFFDDISKFEALKNPTLDEWRQKINVRHAHLTSKDLTELISDFKWNISEIANNLVPPLGDFFNDKRVTKLRDTDRESSLAYLEQIEAFIK